MYILYIRTYLFVIIAYLVVALSDKAKDQSEPCSTGTYIEPYNAI